MPVPSDFKATLKACFKTTSGSDSALKSWQHSEQNTNASCVFWSPSSLSNNSATSQTQLSITKYPLRDVNLLLYSPDAHSSKSSSTHDNGAHIWTPQGINPEASCAVPTHTQLSCILLALQLQVLGWDNSGSLGRGQSYLCGMAFCLYG